MVGQDPCQRYGVLEKIVGQESPTPAIFKRGRSRKDLPYPLFRVRLFPKPYFVREYTPSIF
jgi:hypothetical protein